MCGRAFLSNHKLRVYCVACSNEREKESKRKWAREHPEKCRKHASNYRARHMVPVPTKGYIWDLIFDRVEDETFERGAIDGLIYEEDRTYAAWYAERHNFE